MKKLVLIAAAAFMAACSQPDNGYTVSVSVTGDLTQLPNDTLILTGGTRKSPVADTAVLKGGKVTFKGETKTPTYYSLSFKGGRAFTSVFVENQKYNVTFDASDLMKVEIVGGDVQTFLNEVNAKKAELYAANNLDSLMKMYRELNDEQKKELSALRAKCDGEVKEMVQAYLAANPVSDYALYTLATEVGKMPVEEAEAKLVAFDTLPAFAENVILKETKEVVALIKSLQPGNQAPDFVQNDPNGNPIKFSDIYSKNKLTMVDFWASWCGPCRAFNPELVKIYKKYHKKGFEIIGVSHDQDHGKWVKGIADDNLTWPQVSDLKYWDNEVGKMYYVRYIPQNIFVDQNGVIVGRQIDKPEVDKFIEDYLKK